MSVRRHSRLARIVRRVPLKVALALVRPIALLNHRWYMPPLVRVLRWAGVRLEGVPRYIAPSVFFDDFDRVTLGDRVVISSGVSLLTHDYSWTTVRIANGAHVGGDEAVVRPIRIGHNVFVGRGSLIMPGARIGDHVIIGAGSVVRGVVESGSVVMGNPAQKTTTVQALYERDLTRVADLDIRKDRVA